MHHYGQVRFRVVACCEWCGTVLADDALATKRLLAQARCMLFHSLEATSVFALTVLQFVTRDQQLVAAGLHVRRGPGPLLRSLEEQERRAREVLVECASRPIGLKPWACE